MLCAGLWTLTEWLRGWLFTGFPWLALGYSQTPPSPLAGYAAVLGGYGLGFLVGVHCRRAGLGLRRRAGRLLIVAAAGVAASCCAASTGRKPVGAPVTRQPAAGQHPAEPQVGSEPPLSIDTYLVWRKENPAR